MVCLSPDASKLLNRNEKGPAVAMQAAGPFNGMAHAIAPSPARSFAERDSALKPLRQSYAQLPWFHYAAVLSLYAPGRFTRQAGDIEIIDVVIL